LFLGLRDRIQAGHVRRRFRPAAQFLRQRWEVPYREPGEGFLRQPLWHHRAGWLLWPGDRVQAGYLEHVDRAAQLPGWERRGRPRQRPGDGFRRQPLRHGRQRDVELFRWLRDRVQAGSLARADRAAQFLGRQRRGRPRQPGEGFRRQPLRHGRLRRDVDELSQLIGWPARWLRDRVQAGYLEHADRAAQFLGRQRRCIPRPGPAEGFRR
jgi:hypothetical protein